MINCEWQTLRFQFSWCGVCRSSFSSRFPPLHHHHCSAALFGSRCFHIILFIALTEADVQGDMNILFLWAFVFTSNHLHSWKIIYCVLFSKVKSNIYFFMQRFSKKTFSWSRFYFHWSWAESSRGHKSYFLATKQTVDTTAADWHSALLKPSVRRKIMCIPIIYILCVKILRMYSVKKTSFMLMVICCVHIPAAWAASSTVSSQHEGQREAVWSALWNPPERTPGPQGTLRPALGTLRPALGTAGVCPQTSRTTVKRQ